jgi:hypothetical protein
MKTGNKLNKAITIVVPELLLILSFFSPPVMGGSRAFRSGPSQEPAPSRSRRGESGQAERLRAVMIPLIQAMDHPCSANEVRISMINQSEINAGNAGGCQFLVTEAFCSRRTMISYAGCSPTRSRTRILGTSRGRKF